jgi:hypothetical protein
MTAIFAVPEMTNFVFAHVPRPSRCNQQIIAFWAFHPVGREIVAPIDRHDERPLSLASLYGVQRWTHYDMSNLDLGTCCFVASTNLLIAIEPEWTIMTPFDIGWHQFAIAMTVAPDRNVASNESLASSPRFLCRRLDQDERELSGFAVRGARCGGSRALRDDRVPRDGRFPLGRDKYRRRAQARRGIEGRFSATRGRCLADNEPRG